MSTRHLVPAFRQLRRVLTHSEPGSDSQLLQRFLDLRDESAFELLVWRHGPMVQGVCRRLLRDDHDAEDAFQAAFLLLARKAASIGRGECLGGWLYKVAYRVALRARDGALRRARHERPVPEVPAVADPHATDVLRDEWQPVLDEELSRLAEKHRAPVVLCYLEGLTNEQAAQRLGCPVGTVKTRLAHARRLLAARLARRGLALAAGLPPAPAPPAALVGMTVRAAALTAAGKVAVLGAVSAPVAALMEGGLRAMMVTKLKAWAAVLTVGLAVAGAGTASLQVLAAEPGGVRGDEPLARPAPTPAEARAKQLRKQITDLTAELRRAEQEAARERAVPPRKTPVAVIFGNVPITRDELADHVLSRLTTQQLNGYIHRRILEHACKKEGVTVTDEEVEAHLKATLAKMNYNAQTFEQQVLQRQQPGKTLREWKEDVIRTQLMLEKLARKVRVSEKEVRKAYEAKYGEKVECDVIVAGSEQIANDISRRLRLGESTFEQEQGRTRPHSHPTVIDRQRPGHEAMVEAVFALRTGEVSSPIKLRGGYVLLKCRRRIPTATNVRFEDVREDLRCELRKQLDSANAETLFKKLKAEARVQLLWAPPEEERKPN